MKPRAIYVKDSKTAALALLRQGKLEEAANSMIRSMKRDQLCGCSPTLEAIAGLYVANNDIDGVRRFINGFS